MGRISNVSIQLVSPASGERGAIRLGLAPKLTCFHSISFPSEWREFATEAIPRAGFSHQIDAPLKYSVDKQEKASNYKPQTQSLQSIDAPQPNSKGYTTKRGASILAKLASQAQ